MEYPLDQTIQAKSNKFTKLGKFIPKKLISKNNWETYTRARKIYKNI